MSNITTISPSNLQSICELLNNLANQFDQFQLIDGDIVIFKEYSTFNFYVPYKSLRIGIEFMNPAIKQYIDLESVVEVSDEVIKIYHGNSSVIFSK